MRILATLFLLGFANMAQSEDYCIEGVEFACGKVGGGSFGSFCNSHYSGVLQVKSNLQKYTATHLDQNWKYLLMSTYFNNYETNREGFSKLYRKLADDAWEDTIDLIKYMAKRGFGMSYIEATKPNDTLKLDSPVMSELHSLGTALDMQKLLAREAHHIHKLVMSHSEGYHDAETMNFIESEFASKHADRIRELAGYANDLRRIISKEEESKLAIYLFDEHLKKVVE